MLTEPRPATIDTASFNSAEYYQNAVDAINNQLVPINTLEIDDELQRYRDEARVMASMAITQLTQDRPGVGDTERSEFGSAVESFAFATARMEMRGRTTGQNVLRLTQLDSASSSSVIDELIQRYMTVVHSRERKAAEDALSKYWRQAQAA